MRNLVLTAGDIIFHEVLFEEVSAHVLYSVLAKEDESFALHPVRGLAHLFVHHLEEVVPAWSMMLKLQDLGQTVAGGFFDLIISLVDEVHEHWHKVLVNFRHVEVVNDLCHILDELNVLSPHSSVTLNVINIDHQSLQ